MAREGDAFEIWQRDAEAAPPEDAAATARDLSRLAALHDDDILGDAEFVAAVGTRLGVR